MFTAVPAVGSGVTHSVMGPTPYLDESSCGGFLHRVLTRKDSVKSVLACRTGGVFILMYFTTPWLQIRPFTLWYYVIIISCLSFPVHLKGWNSSISSGTWNCSKVSHHIIHHIIHKRAGLSLLSNLLSN